VSISNEAYILLIINNMQQSQKQCLKNENKRLVHVIIALVNISPRWQRQRTGGPPIPRAATATGAGLPRRFPGLNLGWICGVFLRH